MQLSFSIRPLDNKHWSFLRVWCWTWKSMYQKAAFSPLKAAAPPEERAPLQVSTKRPIKDWLKEMLIQKSLLSSHFSSYNPCNLKLCQQFKHQAGSTFTLTFKELNKKEKCIFNEIDAACEMHKNAHLENLFLVAFFLSFLLVISVVRNKKLRLISKPEFKRKRQSSCQARHWPSNKRYCTGKSSLYAKAVTMCQHKSHLAMDTEGCQTH